MLTVDAMEAAEAMEVVMIMVEEEDEVVAMVEGKALDFDLFEPSVRV